MNVILGGGVVALFARDILGPSWHIIPVGRSLYYSFSPPLADNYIVRDEKTDEYFNFVSHPECIKNMFSIGGHLTQEMSVLNEWLSKKYKNDIPPQSVKYWNSHMNNFAYPGLINIYRDMQIKYQDEIIQNNNEGHLVKIDLSNREIHLSGKVIEYEYIINTLPLYAFLEIAKIDYHLPSLDLWCYHVRSETIDLEGATNVFIVDKAIEFYQVSKVGNIDYIFYAISEVQHPAVDFMSIIDKFDLVNETMIPKGIQCGSIPKIEMLKDGGIINVGSGVWDDCLDIGSVLLRLLKIKNTI